MDDRAVGDAFTRISVGAAAHTALELVRERVVEQQYAIDMDMYRRIEAGRLTGEAAMMAFATKRALFELLKSLMATEKAGGHAARKLVTHGAA